MKNKKLLKILIIIVSIALSITLVIHFFGFAILNLVASILLKNNPVNTTDGVGYLFEDNNTFFDSPAALSGMELTPMDVNMSSFTNNVSNDLDVALYLFSVGEENMSKLHTFGVFTDINGEFVLSTAAKKPINVSGTIVSQLIKIQNGNSFFMNEAFALRSASFDITTNVEALEQLLINNVCGGNRIYMDDVSKEKWIQFAPQGSTRYDEEKKLVILSLPDATLGYIKDIDNYPSREAYFSQDNEMHSGYNKEYEFSKLLMVDFSTDTVSAARTEYYPEEKYYKINYTMIPEGLTASDKAGGAIANLFGRDGNGNPNVNKIVFEAAEFEVEVWNNGLLKSIKANITWNGDSDVAKSFLGTLKARAEDTSINFYFTYTDNDCSDETLRSKYYDGVVPSKKCSLITRFPDVPIIKDNRFDCTDCHLEQD